jgi:hypothetical protein
MESEDFDNPVEDGIPGEHSVKGQPGQKKGSNAQPVQGVDIVWKDQGGRIRHLPTTSVARSHKALE